MARLHPRISLVRPICRSSGAMDSGNRQPPRPMSKASLVLVDLPERQDAGQDRGLAAEPVQEDLPDGAYGAARGRNSVAEARASGSPEARIRRRGAVDERVDQGCEEVGPGRDRMDRSGWTPWGGITRTMRRCHGG